MHPQTNAQGSPAAATVASTPRVVRPVTPAESTSAPRPQTIISPLRGWFDWRLGQLWRYRDLITLFVWRDFVSVYKQTILGPLWHILRPVLTTLIYTVVFARMAGLSTDGAPPFLFYMAGQLVWMYFASCLENISKTFTGNTQLLGKVYFHRLVIPVSLLLSNLIAFAIQLVPFLILLVVYYGGSASPHVTRWILAVPLVLVVLAGYALGAGIILCALTTRYRDLNHLVSFGIQLLMFLTPVIYPISAVPLRYRSLAELNPLTPLVETFRLGFLGVGTVTIDRIVASALIMMVVVAAGLMMFTRVERTFMDTV